MFFTGNFLVLAKVSEPWTDNAGNSHLSYSINVAQKNGEIVDRLRLSKDLWDDIVTNQNYSITVEISMGRNGLYMRVTELVAIN